ncbi:MAG: tetratricopeptide repeat protein [Phycisphaerales bacterium JB054]
MRVALRRTVATANNVLSRHVTLGLVYVLGLASSALAQSYDVTFRNEGDEDLYLVEASREGWTWGDDWRVAGWYKIPAGGHRTRVDVQHRVFGFINDKYEVEIFKPQRQNTTFPEIVRQVKVHPQSPFDYRIKDAGGLGDEFITMEMSFVFQAVGDHGAKGRYTITLTPDKQVPGVPLQRPHGTENKAVDASGRTSAQASYLQGQSLYYGRGIAQNYTEAAEHYRAAAEKGHAASQAQLGYMHLTGEGVARDEREAVRWLRLAAEQANANAQANLGYLYLLGRGVERDDIAAARWCRLAADQGVSSAQNTLGVLFEAGRGVKKDEAEAARWYRKAAEQGHVAAQLNLGHLYKAGRGVGQDDAVAVHWYRTASEQGDADAQCHLGYMYGAGRGVARDDAEAVRWYRRAAEQGNETAQANLGHRYRVGRGIAQDESKAIEWYLRAAEQGSPEALEALQGLKSTE